MHPVVLYIASVAHVSNFSASILLSSNLDVVEQLQYIYS